jgi:hypothetical protein
LLFGANQPGRFNLGLIRQKQGMIIRRIDLVEPIGATQAGLGQQTGDIHHNRTKPSRTGRIRTTSVW